MTILLGLHVDQKTDSREVEEMQVRAGFSSI